MKIFILRPKFNPPETHRLDEYNQDNPWEPWWDKAFGFVVRAENEAKARGLASKEAGDEKDQRAVNPWLDENFSTCEELNTNGEEGILMRDFAKG